MLRNYLTLAVRFMLKQAAFSFINIFGLTIGITCSLLILLYVHYEWSYDRFIPDAERVYRLNLEGRLQRRSIKTSQTAGRVAREIVNKIPEVEEASRLVSWSTFPMRIDSEAFTEKYILLADSNFFDFFGQGLVVGNANEVLSGQRKVVVTESAATKYLGYKGGGDRSPLGKKLVLAQGYEAFVSGIAKDPPENSHFHYSFVLSLSSWPEVNENSWYGGDVATYFKITRGASIDHTLAQINQLLTKRINEELRVKRNITIEEFRKLGNEIHFTSVPLTGIHLRAHYENEIEANSSIQSIYIFSSIAFFILLLACINFMNLSTARSASRSKEVAVRKTMGAHVSLIIHQFLLESYLYLAVAIILSMILAFIFIGPFNYFTGKHINMDVLLHPAVFFGTLLSTIVLGLLAGSYPALYLSRFTPIQVLKGKLRRKLQWLTVRNVLVVFQFFISASLIIATIVVYQQLNYIQKADLGFRKENVIDLLHTKNLGSNAESFKFEISKIPGVVSASFCNRLPPKMDWQSLFRVVGSKQDHLITVYEMDYDHLTTMGYTMKEGRFFSPTVGTDSTAVILNETAIKKMKLAGALDRSVVTEYDQVANLERRVIGVMHDFNFQSLHEEIQPLAIILGRSPNWEMAIRIEDTNREITLELIRESWKKHAPGAPFEYSFLDENFEILQKSEVNVASLFLLFTLLAISIACLGLFGLATFATEQRTKEIGIRKVLGATIVNLGVMLNIDFMRLVLLANLLAWPFAWWMMTLWLGQFAYHINFQWWFLVVAGAITVSIALISVSYQVVKVTLNNPVESLRYD